MAGNFQPEANKAYFMEQNTLFQMLEGKGGIQVDFNNYWDWDDKLIFLEQGQYIRFLSDSFVVRKISFDLLSIAESIETRVLFKHLVSLGSINYRECEDCQRYFTHTLPISPEGILDVSVRQWYRQNPFHANRQEYKIIFDTKELIDREYKNHRAMEDLTQAISADHRQVHSLVRKKLGLSIKSLELRKRMTEDQKLLAFTDRPIQAIAYEQGYKDPSYFVRAFKNRLVVTPGEFREQAGYELEDGFTRILFQLLQEYHTSQRTNTFYADRLCMSEKNLAKKIKQRLNTTLGQLIRQKVIRTAKQSLASGEKIKEVALALGFEEANHFSSFFKRYTQFTPTEFQHKNYHR